MAKFWDRFNPFTCRRQRSELEGLYPPEKFRSILERECVRTDRTGQELSLVIFDVGSGAENSFIIRDLAHVLFRRVRVTDEIGWIDERSIGVILTATPAQGAWKFTDEICQKLTETPKNLSWRVYTYPTQWLINQNEQTKETQVPVSPSTKSLHSATQSNVRLAESLLVRRFHVWKRVLDILGAVIGLLVFSPMILAVAGVIKLTSKGPVLFRQERVGQYGKIFIFLKFRTMYVNCDERLHREYVEKYICTQKSTSMSEKNGESGIYKLQNDPRITPFGRFLRKTSLDELPQFINVIKGEMSLVGPRPPIPYECAHYDLWHKKRTWEVKPGITGLWQVKGRSGVTFDEMVRFDIRYSRECSLWMDIGILLKTPWAVVTCKGAY